jgi:hypothetical protein
VAQLAATVTELQAAEEDAEDIARLIDEIERGGVQSV